MFSTSAELGYPGVLLSEVVRKTLRVFRDDERAALSRTTKQGSGRDRRESSGVLVSEANEGSEGA
jgi:hypothetical protein